MCFRGSCNHEKKYLFKSCVSDLGTLFRLIGIGYEKPSKKIHWLFSVNFYKIFILAKVQAKKYIEQ